MPVLERAQERVGLVAAAAAVVAADVAAGGERAPARSAWCALRSDVVGAAVHQLQQLDGELDVAQPAGAELELALGLGGRDVLDDPAAHRLHVGDEAVALGGRPHQRRDRRRRTPGPASRSPATGRALSSAWNSQVLAQRS